MRVMGQWRCRARRVNGTPIPAVELVSTQKIRQLTYIAEEDPFLTPAHPIPPPPLLWSLTIALTQRVWHNRCQDTAAHPQYYGQNYTLQTNRFNGKQDFSRTQISISRLSSTFVVVSVPYWKATVLLQPLLTQHIQQPRRQKITDHTDNM